jgi:dTDP-4-dehydrorhamnose reductase
MEQIREINPNAQLVQTDDLGKVFSTPLLAYQAKFENERRWLTYDLLCGRVRRGHALWRYLQRDAGITTAELAFFVDHPCPPDIIGVNYYLTSERLLDERLALYPASTHGGNGRHAYADVESVRLRPEGLVGARELLREVWDRYGIPIAVTEVHNGCTREEQLRWLSEIWQAAVDLRADGVDLEAVTVWALLGTFDWNSLVTRREGHYEPGAYDVRAPEPRPTALAGMARELAEGKRPSHPVLDMPGWWRRTKRLVYPHALETGALRPSLPPAQARPLLVTGANGTLGRGFAERCEVRGLAYRLLTRAEMDIADADSVEAALALYGGWAVVNAAGYVRVDDAEHQPDQCIRENTDGPSILAQACAARGVNLLTFSSDLVFDGAQSQPYVESDPTSPLNVYGKSKAAAELAVLTEHPRALVVRTSAFFGPWDDYNFVTQGLRGISRGDSWIAADDVVVSPTYVPDLVDASLDLLIDRECGLWHLANTGAVSWADFARRAAEAAGLDANLVVGVPLDQMHWPARRPLFSALESSRGWLMPSLDSALTRYVGEYGWGLETTMEESAAGEQLQA